MMSLKKIHLPVWCDALSESTSQLTSSNPGDNNEDFNSPLFDGTADTTTRELVTPLENGLYYWRVRAINMYDVPGEWGVPWTITINAP